jgi:hypothetical protein
MESTVAFDTGVIDQDIDRTEITLDLREDFTGAAAIAHIGLNCEGGGRVGRCRLIRLMCECHGVARGSEGFDHGAADTAAASGDENDRHEKLF